MTGVTRSRTGCVTQGRDSCHTCHCGVSRITVAGRTPQAIPGPWPRTLCSSWRDQREMASASLGSRLAPSRRNLRTAEESLSQLLEQSRIIPAVRSPEFLIPAVTAPGKIVYFLCGNPENLPQMVEVVVSSGKVAIVNLDLVSGLSRDAEAIGFLARRKVQGIISTHLEPLRAARHLGLFAIERTFLLDSAALSSSLRSIDQFVPDALEVLPAAVAPEPAPGPMSRLSACWRCLPATPARGVFLSKRKNRLLFTGPTPFRLRPRLFHLPRNQDRRGSTAAAVFVAGV